MREIVYEDCNNNAAFLKELFVQIQELSVTELSWSISNLEFIPVDQGDFIDCINLYNEKMKISIPYQSAYGLHMQKKIIAVWGNIRGWESILLMK